MRGDIYLEGSVGAAFWPEDPHFTTADVRGWLAGQGDVTVHINSGGGIASEGLAIYHLLKDHPGSVHVVVSGTAVSAASLIVMAGDRITMRMGASLMIHDPAVGFTQGRGTEDDHRAVADMLAGLADGYAAIYAERAGIDAEAAREIMRAETWFSPDEAIAAGFADDVGDVEASAAARFPYHVYANSPPHLLSGAGAKGPGKRAVMALMCGISTPRQEPEMAKKPTAKTATTMAEDDNEDIKPEAELEDEAEARAESEEDADEAEAEGGEDPDEAEAEGAETEDEEDGDAVAILDLVSMHGGTVATARDFIAKRTPIQGVIAHYREKGPSVTKHKPGGATARITRDERETRRIGMTEALAAQIGRRKPTDDRARPFMSLSLAEMAALSNGHRGPLRTANDRLEVFMAMHSTSDFPLSLQNALNKELETRYREANPTYRRIARQKTFRDFRPHPIIRPGDFPTLQPIGEGGEIKYGTIGEKAETVALVSYGIAMSITRQTLINDDIGAIADTIADQGRAVSRFEDATFYKMMLGGAGSDGPTLAETTRQVFNTTDGTKAATAAAINVTSLSVGRAAMMKQTSVDKNLLGILPSILLVGPDKLTEAQQIVAPIQADQAGNVNPFAGILEVVPSARITGNAWYLLADPADLPCFVYGYLEGAAAPRTRMEEPFGRQGMQLSIEHDFGVGAIDFRGGYKNAGA
ncbi:ATP-dependent protease ClpP, protease subunit [Gemmobacter megaterium]|uniref:ATP-dependent Clp protease proteolytic subunit n=1 Tax=Gemmobacter megaterium TaxID=1086013 RepID=A0A1N7QIM4_9RHOB|nr:head maturation protease, ClpP-related [Gemmobacter megaterium]GGE26642.1 terminase [Gemmobacter megaterium]SIT22715.1 ATP-dependent protease ClpP, protease subunit [Gemmobacter megaterium]